MLLIKNKRKKINLSKGNILYHKKESIVQRNEFLGFTLVELLAIVAIIGILAIITIPTVSYQLRNYRFRLYEDQIDSIELAAKNWASEHMALLPEKEGDEIVLTLGDLKIGGYIDDEVRDPRNKKYFPNSMIVRIIKKDFNYIYIVEEGEGTEDNVPIIDDKTPTIVLLGKKEVTISYGETYYDAGAKATSYKGEVLTNIKVTITINGEEVESINTLKIGTYKIRYEITDESLTAFVERIVNVKDDSIPENIEFKIKTIGTNFVMVEASANFVSGIEAYEYSLDNGFTWTSKSLSNVHTFTNLKHNTTYVAKVRITGKNGYKAVSKPIFLNTTDITVPIYHIDNIGWAAKKTVTITYPKRESYFIYEYSLDKGNTWILLESPKEVANISFEHNGTVTARISDGTNIVTATTYQVTKVDDKVPIINSITGNDTRWVTSVTLVVNAIDNESGLHDMAYSFDGGKTWQKENSKKFTSNTTVDIRVRDKVLNVTQKSSATTIELDYIDSEVATAPTIMGGSNTWINGTRNIYVSKDATSISGIKNYQYYISTSATSQTGGSWIDLPSGTKNVSIGTNGTRYIYFRAVNNAGTIGKVSNAQITKIDTGVPTVPTLTGGSTAWSSAAKNISVSKDSTSTSGIKNYQYYISTSNTGQVGGSWTNLAAGTKNISISTNGTRYIYFRAVNNVGTIGKVSNAQITKIDTGVPTAPAITGGSTAWIKGTRTISVSKASTSTSGIKNYQYYISTSSTGQAGGSWKNLAAGTTSIKITTNGTRYIYFRAVNNAGKAGTVSAAQTTKIDTTAPTVPTAGAIGTTSGTGTTGTIQTVASGSTDTGGSGGIVYKYLVTTSSTAPANTNTGFTTSRNYTRKCGTKYYGWAIAEDAVGNRSAVKSLGNTTSFSCTEYRYRTRTTKAKETYWDESRKSESSHTECSGYHCWCSGYYEGECLESCGYDSCTKVWDGCSGDYSSCGSHECCKSVKKTRCPSGTTETSGVCYTAWSSWSSWSATKPSCTASKTCEIETRNP